MSRLVAFWALASLAACTPLEGGRDLGGELGIGDLAVGDGPAPADFAGGLDGAAPSWCGHGYDSVMHTFCEDFETPQLNPNDWNQTGTGLPVGTDSTHVAHGSASLRIDMTSSDTAGIQLNVGAVPPPARPLWLRFYAYLPSALRPNRLTIARIAHQELSIGMNSIELAAAASSTGFPLDAWACVEIQLTSADATHTNLDLWVDKSHTLTLASAPVTGLEELILGGATLNAGATYPIWFDELVISSTEPGCPL